jgi:hypothetical protein
MIEKIELTEEQIEYLEGSITYDLLATFKDKINEIIDTLNE